MGPGTRAQPLSTCGPGESPNEQARVPLASEGAGAWSHGGGPAVAHFPAAATRPACLASSAIHTPAPLRLLDDLARVRSGLGMPPLSSSEP